MTPPDNGSVPDKTSIAERDVGALPARGKNPDASERLVSFVIMARNDEYMGNAKWRLETTLEFLAQGIETLGRLDAAEIIIVDWQSAVPLHQVLHVSDAVRRLVRHIIVPTSLPDSISFDSDFPRPILLNIGIRRSRGRYIVQTLGDVLWTPETLGVIFDWMEGKTPCQSRIAEALVVIGRREIPYDIATKSPGIDFLAEYLRDARAGFEDPRPHPFFLVPADSIMMHRDLWFSSRGFDERLQHWGWIDCDLILRVGLRHRVLSKLDDPRLNVCHLSHIDPNRMNELNETRDQNPWLFNDFTINGEDWGLGMLSFDEHPAGSSVFPPAGARRSTPAVHVPLFRGRYLLRLIMFAAGHPTRDNVCFSLSCAKLILTQCLRDLLRPLAGEKSTT